VEASPLPRPDEQYSLPSDGDHLSSMPECDFQLAVDVSTVSRVRSR
jgi:hypothetical protein